MKVDAQEYLDLVEQAHKIVFLDIESQGLRGDYGAAICVSLKPYDMKPYTFVVKQPGNDQKIVNDAKRALESYNCWVTYYGKGFDIKFLNTRLLKWGSLPIDKRPHLDMYFTLKGNILTARRSQSHLLTWLKTPEQKMSVSADDWASLCMHPKKILPTMVARCESDVTGLEALYKQTRHIVSDITR